MVFKMKRFQVLYPQVLRNDVGYIRIVILKKNGVKEKGTKDFLYLKATSSLSIINSCKTNNHDGKGQILIRRL